MNYTKQLTMLSLCFVSLLATQSYAHELVKTCQEFKTTFLQACQIIGDEALTEKMKFLQTHLNYGGSIIYSEIITIAIDDCTNILTIRAHDTKIKNIINDLNDFKAQINSDESYDLNTGTVYKRETLRSGKTRVEKIPYNANHCYRVYIEHPK